MIGRGGVRNFVLRAIRLARWQEVCMAVRKELIEELLANRNPEEVFAQDGLLDELKKALAERILNAEMDQHLAAERADEVIGEPRNHRNGHSRKTVLTGTGKLD